MRRGIKKIKKQMVFLSFFILVEELIINFTAFYIRVQI